MKSLNFSQPLMLFVVGRPGAGKSFFARQFSEMFGAPVVSVNRVRYELFAEPRFSAEENEVIARLVTYQVEELLKTKRSFLIDGACNAKVDRQQFAQAGRKVGFQSLVIWVQTDEVTCRNRAERRNGSQPDDAYSAALSRDQFETLAKRFTEPKHENHVVISGKQTFGAQARSVLRKLVVPREAEAEAAHQLKNQAIVSQHHHVRPDVARRSVIIR